jgi:hypothetical protein
VAFGEVDPDTARAALLAEPDDDVAEVAHRWTPARWRLHERATPAERERLLAFGLSLFAALHARGFDPGPLGLGATADRSRWSPDTALLAIACLRAHPEAPDRFRSLVAWAVAQGWWADALGAELRRHPSLGAPT